MIHEMKDTKQLFMEGGLLLTSKGLIYLNYGNPQYNKTAMNRISINNCIPGISLINSLLMN